MGAQQWLQQWEVIPPPQELSPTSPVQGPHQPGTNPFSSPVFLLMDLVIQQQPLGASYEISTPTPKKETREATPGK